jgi:hypothetical protein
VNTSSNSAVTDTNTKKLATFTSPQPRWRVQKRTRLEESPTKPPLTDDFFDEVAHRGLQCELDWRTEIFRRIRQFDPDYTPLGLRLFSMHEKFCVGQGDSVALPPIPLARREVRSEI